MVSHRTALAKWTVISRFHTYKVQNAYARWCPTGQPWQSGQLSVGSTLTKFRMPFWSIKKYRNRQDETNQTNRSKQGQISTDPLEISRWREYFKSWNTRKEARLELKKKEVNIEVKSKIQLQEVRMAIDKLRNGKAPGVENIRADIEWQ
ncbi:hypothetical protein QE152_g29541 [Popillia japonica]|uniref:Uncharacterized protein n=1 Tax=Popillia japonica TaxID=7064 RepID=A0AAW1JHF2_POPJA